MMGQPTGSSKNMSTGEVFRQLFSEQLRLRPESELGDLLKALHQSVFGCGHLVSTDSLPLLEEELSCQPHNGYWAQIELLGERFCRVPLAYLIQHGLSAATLDQLFRLSAQKPAGSIDTLETGLMVLTDMVREGLLPFSEQDTAQTIAQWRADGFPACHHSERVKEKYPVAYRVIHQEYLWVLPLLCRIDQLLARQHGGIVALEGGSASGKTTLAALLKQLYSCQVFHMDDFFLRPAQRTPERLAEPGGNVDRERFLEEVLLPTVRKEPVRLCAYDCHTQSMRPPVLLPHCPLTIVEGAYSMHPALAPHYDLSAFLSISPELQAERLRHRNTPEEQERFKSTWIPLELRYFTMTSIRERCDLILKSHSSPD